MKQSRQKGAQAVEFALVLPFMIFIIFAVLDFGFVVYNKAIVTNASREGARYGILASKTWDATAVRQVACNYAKSAVISAGGTAIAANCSTAPLLVTVTSESTPPAFNSWVKVEVTFTTKGFSLGNWWGLGSPIGDAFDLTSSTTMLHE